MQSDAIDPHPVWPENVQAIEIALSCHWERAVSLSGQVWQGIRTTEIESELRIHRIPLKERAPLKAQVRMFVRVACAELNELEAQRASENRSKR